MVLVFQHKWGCIGLSHPDKLTQMFKKVIQITILFLKSFFLLNHMKNLETSQFSRLQMVLLICKYCFSEHGTRICICDCFFEEISLLWCGMFTGAIWLTGQKSTWSHSTKYKMQLLVCITHQPAFTYSKLTVNTLEQAVKYIQT